MGSYARRSKLGCQPAVLNKHISRISYLVRFTVRCARELARVQPLWPVTVSGLAALIGGRASSGPVFLNRYGSPITRFGIHTLVERSVLTALSRCASMEIKRVSPHTIPHTGATHLLRAGVDINTIRGWLGHVSLETTNIYAEIDFETKAKALVKCDVPNTEPVHRRWRDQPALMDFPRAL
jgi:integrase/recombinase XerD